MRMASQVTYRYVALLLISNSSEMSFLGRALRFVFSNNRINASEVSPFTSLITPNRDRFCSFVLGLSRIACPQGYSKGAKGFNRRIFHVLRVVGAFGVRSITRGVHFGSNFPDFRFFPARVQVKRVNGLVTQVSSEQFTRCNKVDITRWQLNEMNFV